MTTKQFDQVTTLGIDIGKNTFHLIGLDSKGAIVLRQKLSRGQVREWLANLPLEIEKNLPDGTHLLGVHAQARDAQAEPERQEQRVACRLAADAQGLAGLAGHLYRRHGRIDKILDAIHPARRNVHGQVTGSGICSERLKGPPA